MTGKGITKAQAAAFWRMFAAACRAQGLPAAEREPYRKRIMKEECGVEHLAEVDRTRGYDALMRRVNEDAGAYDYAAKFVGGDGVRMVHLVERCANQLMQLACRPVDEAYSYVGGILRHAGIFQEEDGARYLLDIPVRDAQAVFQMLDTHRRRLIRRQGQGKDCPLAFDAGASYSIDVNGTVHRSTRAPAPAYYTVKAEA